MPEPKKKTVKILRPFIFDKKAVPVGTVATYDQTFADELIHNGKAIASAAVPKTETETVKLSKEEKGERHAK